MIAVFLCLVSLPGAVSWDPPTGIPYPNKAYYKPSEMSSVATDDIYGLLRAQYGADGDSIQTRGFCAETIGTDLWNWFMVDLTTIISVKSIRITNYCCRDTLRNFTIEISAEDPRALDGFPGVVRNANVCIVHPELVPQDAPIAYHCDEPIEGRFVRLVQYNPTAQPITLCELEVFDYYESNITQYFPDENNLALNKSTNASAFWDYSFNFEAKNAVDGILDGRFEMDSCFCSSMWVHPHWWSVDLGENYLVYELRLLAPLTCCQWRLKGFTIEVSEENPAELDGFPGRATKQSVVCITQSWPILHGEPVRVRCDKPRVGRYVRLVMEQGQSLSFCEAEVLGFKPKRRFGYVASNQGGGGIYENSATSKRYLNRCIRTLMARGELEAYATPFVHVDLEDGACHFSKLSEDWASISGSSWIVYNFE